jgi:hypothetical protein
MHKKTRRNLKLRRVVAEREVKEHLSPPGILSNVSELFSHLLISNSTKFASGTSGDFSINRANLITCLLQ